MSQPSAAPDTRRKGPILLIGTRKGLFAARQESGCWRLDGPHIAGYEVLQTYPLPSNPDVIYAAARHPIWGAHLYRSVDRGARWTSLPGAPRHPTGRHQSALSAIWGLAQDAAGRLYAGIDPAGLFFSDDEAETWYPVYALNEHSTREFWEPARGGYSIHSIQLHPTNPDLIWVAVSAGGVYRSEDRGRSWTPCNRGIPARNRPEPEPVAGHNVHRLVMHPLRPERLYRQCYHGTWRSDDGGQSWLDITAGLPGDFGYAIAVDPHDPDGVFQVPESDAHLRSVVDGRLRVYRSRDGGGTWEDSSSGLPQENAWVTVLREALAVDHATPCGVYFGTSSGHVFASLDGGASWHRAAEFLPRILSVRALGQSD
jgi:photosystem II stability/assembly factor-like uncharacterized protein